MNSENLIEILKYFSPVAILGMIWAIIQFYQKRSFEKKDKLRNEKLQVYKQLHYHLKEMYSAMISYQESVMQNTQTLKTNYKIHEKKRDKVIAELELAQNKIREKEGAEGDEFNLNNEIQIQKERILSLEEIINESDDLLVSNNERVREDARNLILKLKSELKKINEIPLLFPYSKVEIINLISLITPIITQLLLPVENDDFKVGTDDFKKFNDDIAKVLEASMKIDQVLYNEVT